MKPSRYNNFIRMDGGNVLAFNSLSATLSEVFPENIPIIEKLMANSSPPETDEEKEIHAALVEGRYLVESEFDELEFLKVRNRRFRFDKNAFFLTIAPTLACNFACDYCFESQRPERMTPETEQAILKFSENYMKRAEFAGVIWFGGEPTLCVPTIERLQTGLQELAARCGASFDPASIITNGYLMDGKMAERLKKVGVESSQITIDGPREIHDRRRKLHSGGGTFDRIMSNLSESAGIMKTIIRINVDQQNIERALEVVDELQKRGVLSKVHVNFAQVHQSQGVCADIEKHCLSTEAFSQHQVELYRQLIERGFYGIDYPSLTLGGHCGADTDGTYAIGPSGDLFKCWEDLSLPEWSVGNVHSDQPTPAQEANLLKYLGWDPFEREACVSCSILPLCMGGCPRRSLEKGKTIGSCCSWKYNLQDMMMLRYECDLRSERR